MIGFPVGLTLVNRRASAFLGRRCGCGAGGHSIRNTGPESTVPAAAPGRLCRPGARAGEGRGGMTEVAVESARQQWAIGHRRLADQAADRNLYLRLLDHVGLVLDELNRRVGQTFTLAELTEAYSDSDRWLLDVLGSRPGGVTQLALVADAAFHVYARGAVDYSP
jgi:hypothetical protein